MGYLHAGHASLVARAAAECDTVLTTVFVNPLQFAAGEDLATYPRDPEGDALTVEAAGGTMMFLPSDVEMYPAGRDQVFTTVAVSELSARWEGATRPEHFAGVCTVVAKLFNLVGECRAYFGEKDFQQLAIIDRMVSDLSFPVDVVGCPIVREPDGLAMSSRNVRLSSDERAVAPVLYRALQAGAAAIRSGTADAAAAHQIMMNEVASEPSVSVDYLEVVNAATLEPVSKVSGPVRLIGAVTLGAVRLLDNLPTHPLETQ
jgi:pantoate--beta-alanine ligase